jgi:hypothetical protein
MKRSLKTIAQLGGLGWGRQVRTPTNTLIAKPAHRSGVNRPAEQTCELRIVA